MNEQRFGKGDDGKSTLASQFKFSKSDPRFSAIGVLDELCAEVYLCSLNYKDETFSAEAEIICEKAEKISQGTATPRDSRFKITDNEISHVYELIASLSKFNAQPLKPINGYAASLYKIRAIARRAEREAVAADLKYGMPAGAIKYLNALSSLMSAFVKRANAEYRSEFEHGAASANPKADVTPTEKIIEKVVNRIMGGSIGLDEAKVLTEKIEKEAERRGKKAVIAICNEQGNPVSAHVMDGAFLVSFDVALKKAYTAVALKMSTMELSSLVQKGETFYGLQSNDKLMIIGGGVPLKRGDKVVGGLGISGGTGEEDHSLCEYALGVFESLNNV